MSCVSAFCALCHVYITGVNRWTDRREDLLLQLRQITVFRHRDCSGARNNHVITCLSSFISDHQSSAPLFQFLAQCLCQCTVKECGHMRKGRIMLTDLIKVVHAAMSLFFLWHRNQLMMMPQLYVSLTLLSTNCSPFFPTAISHVICNILPLCIRGHRDSVSRS